MPVPLKARRAFPYAGRSLKAGDPFNAESKSHARLLIAIGHAEPRKQEYATRVMVPEVKRVAVSPPRKVKSVRRRKAA